MPADELFRSRLENQIDLRHPLARLSQQMPWTALEQALSSRLPATQAGGGRPALPVRLIAGLLYLKHAYDLSDEAVCERWLENPYWQFFTGEVVFQTRLPSDASSLTRWRQRLGEAGMEELLAHTINAAHAMQAVEPVIGHLKDDCRLRRCRLKGAQGDALHVLGCAAGYNLRWLLRWIAFLRAWMRAMGWSSLSTVPLSPTAPGA